MSSLPEQLVRVLATLDDDALVALANRGLVRRASKDLDRETPQLLAGEDETLTTVVLDAATVSMPPAGPAQATCDCPAPGICRHIVAACLFLRSLAAEKASEAAAQTPEATEPGEPAADTWSEVLSLDLDALRTWASADGFRRGVRLERECSGQVERQPALRVRFADGAECRFMPGVGLDGAITTVVSSQRSAYVVAAVLACWRAAGRASALDTAAEAGDPRGPAQRQLAQAVAGLAADAVGTGILHLSPAFADRCRSLAASTEQAGLLRLTRLLQSLAGETELLAGRHAQANEQRVLGKLATMYALCSAVAGTRGPLPVWLIGVSRSEYQPFERLLVAGLSAHRWRTRSGFDGVSVLLFDEAGKRWLSWSDVRRERHRAEHDTEWLYHSAMPWPGGRSVRVASRSRLELCGGKVNTAGRLSGSERCRAVVGDEVDPAHVDFGPGGFHSWQALAGRAREVLPVGLAETSPLDTIVTLFPSHWGVKHFDEVNQVLRWVVLDGEGSPLQLVLPCDATGEQSVLALESADPEIDRLSGLVGRIVFDAHLTAELGFAVLPMTLFGRDHRDRVTLWHLDFDTPASSRTDKKPRRPWWWSRWLAIGGNRRHGGAVGLGSEEELIEELHGIEQLAGLSHSAERVMAAVERSLQALADSGCSRQAAAASEVTTQAEALERLGLARLATVLAAVAEADPCPALLQAAYECALHRRMAAREAIQ